MKKQDAEGGAVGEAVDAVGGAVGDTVGDTVGAGGGVGESVGVRVDAVGLPVGESLTTVHTLLTHSPRQHTSLLFLHFFPTETTLFDV